MAHRMTAVAFAVLILGAAMPGTAQATFPGSTGKLLWGGVVGNPFDPDGNVRPVLPNAAVASQSRWSPDGTKIAYEVYGGGTGTIWVANADGTGAHALTTPAEFDLDYAPAWSADGKQIVFSRRRTEDCGTDCENHIGQLRVTSAEGGGDGTVIDEHQDTGAQYLYLDTEWQPGGDQIVSDVYHGIPEFEAHEVTSFRADGGSYVFHRYQVSNAHDLDPEGSHISWSPDGKRLAYVERHGRTILLFDGQSLSPLGTLSLDEPKRIGGIAFTPDGARMLVGACGDEGVDIACTQHLLLTPPPDSDVDPDEPRDVQLTGPGPDTTIFFRPDFQPADPPVIVVPGFLGTTIVCGSRLLWPSDRVPGALLNMRLNAAGTANAHGTCGPTRGRVIGRWGFLDFYGPLHDQIDKLLTDPNDPRTHDRVYMFPWDWRLDPRPQLGRLNAAIDTALSDDLSKAQGLDDVVLVAHSAGGLLVRAALDNAAIAKKIRRVLTIGTPYLGAAQALFPLYAGVYAPDSPVNSVLIPGELQTLSKNHTGNFILYPSAHYGPWLSIPGRGSLGDEGVVDYVRHLGGSPQAFSRAFGFKASISGFKQLKPAGLREFRVLAGSGIATISGIHILTGGDDVGLDFGSGDGTVPLFSATQTGAGQANPLGDAVRISHLCGIDHLDLIQHRKVFDLVGDFIRYGSPPRKTQPCDFSGFEYTFKKVGGTRATAAAARRAKTPKTPVGPGALRALEKAEAHGVLRVIPLRGGTTVVTGRGFEGSTSFRVRRVVLTATQLGGGRHKPITYGPVSGRLQIRPLKRGKVAIKLNGHKLKRRHGLRRRAG